MSNKRADDKKWGMVIHLAALVGLLLPLGVVLGPVLVWLLKRNDSTFLDTQGKNAINFQLTILLVAFVCIILSVLIRPFIIFALLVGLAGLGFAVVAALQANKHETYKYPYSLKLLK